MGRRSTSSGQHLLRFWRSALVAVVTIPLAGSIHAQQFGVPLPMSGSTNAGFTIDRRLRTKLIAANQKIAAGEYIEAIDLLQEKILNVDEDSFFHPDPNDPALYRSIKLEAQRMIGEMPPAGRAAYETQWGAKARQLLDDSDNDAAALTTVVRHFFHTAAGYDAMNQLASYHMDHGRPLAAALCLDRLKQTPAARDRFDPFLSLKAAYCWERAGVRAAALQALQDLQRKPGRITVAGRDVPVFEDEQQALAWLTGLVGPDGPDSPDPQNQWTGAGGNSERNATSFGGTPYLNDGWRISTLPGAVEVPEQEQEIETTLKRLADDYQHGGMERQVPAIPVGEPLVVGGLVLFRGFGNTSAVELATGKLAWSSAEKDAGLFEATQPQTGIRANATGLNPLSVMVTQRAWRDRTFGMQSSDGELVFAIEELGAQLPVNLGMANGQPHAYSLRDDNQLAAYEVRTGKLAWKLGVPRSDGPDPFAGAFFLGAPLPLGNRLYCLVDFAGEIRLMVVNPQTGALDWSQTLATAELDIIRDPFRRLCGLTPSFSAGILVCPTESGAIVAVDLVTRSLVWGQRYPVSLQFDARRIPQNQRLMMSRTQGAMGNDTFRWLDSFAMLAEGHVVFSPRDANEIQCLRLQDGSVVWKKPRGDALYVACVHDSKVVLIGRTQVQAYLLSNGEPAWPQPTVIPLPSGRGFRAGQIYHLPLNTAEVASINLQTGAIVGRSQSRAGRIPGNLVSVPGAIISQGVDFLESFRQLDALEAEIAADLKQNPNNANALALRGEIHLQRGELKPAFADLKRALELNPDDASVRTLLASSLLEGLRVDFATFRNATSDFQKLLTTPEQKSTYLRLLAMGLESAGDRFGAFQAYLQFADPAIPGSELERLENSHSVNRDRIARTRSEKLYHEATPEERGKMDRELAQRFDSLRGNQNIDELRRFLQAVGNQEAALEPRKLLLDLLISTGQWLEAERELRILEGSSKPEVAATATARHAKLLYDAGRPYDAAHLIRTLESTWADQMALEGKTGRQVAEEWRMKPDIERVLMPPPAWPVGIVETERLAVAGNPQLVRAYSVPIEGDSGVFFKDAILELDMRAQEFSARTADGRSLFKLLLSSQLPWFDPNQFRAFVIDHLVILHMGTRIFAIDVLGTAAEPHARLLWDHSLTDSEIGGISSSRAMPLPGGQRRVVDQFGQIRASLGTVTPTAICFQRGNKLLVIDPLTGNTLWTREGFVAGCELFGDEELLLVAPAESLEATVFRMQDGTSLGTRPIPAVALRLQHLGRTVLVGRVDGNKEQYILERHDPWTKQVTWQAAFSLGARVALVGSDEAAVLELNGQFSVVSLENGQRRWEPSEASRIDPKGRPQQLLVFRDDERYVVIPNIPPPPNAPLRAMPHGIHSIVVYGSVHGFDRGTGKRLWSTHLEPNAIAWSQPNSLPVLTFVSQFLTQQAGGGFSSEYGIVVLDRRNGQFVYRDRRPEMLVTVEPITDPENQRMELRLSQSVLKIKFTDKPVPE